MRATCYFSEIPLFVWRLRRTTGFLESYKDHKFNIKQLFSLISTCIFKSSIHNCMCTICRHYDPIGEVIWHHGAL